MDLPKALIIGSAVLGLCLVLAAYLLSAPRFVAFTHAPGTYVRLDQKTGSAIQCDFSLNCRAVRTDGPDEIDNVMSGRKNPD